MHVMQVGHEQYAETTAACAEALVTVRWLGFHRIWQGSGEAFDHVDLFLPDVQFPTQVSIPPATGLVEMPQGSHAQLSC